MLLSAAPVLVNSFKEMKMSKLRVWGTLVTLVLFAAVALFPTVVQALASKKANCRPAATGFRSGDVLMADGTDPVPPPPPIPWFFQTA